MSSLVGGDGLSAHLRSGRRRPAPRQRSAVTLELGNGSGGLSFGLTWDCGNRDQPSRADCGAPWALDPGSNLQRVGSMGHLCVSAFFRYISPLRHRRLPTRPLRACGLDRAVDCGCRHSGGPARHCEGRPAVVVGNPRASDSGNVDWCRFPNILDLHAHQPNVGHGYPQPGRRDRRSFATSIYAKALPGFEHRHDLNP